jgi:hypothetical protein
LSRPSSPPIRTSTWCSPAWSTSPIPRGRHALHQSRARRALRLLPGERASPLHGRRSPRGRPRRGGE